MTTTWLALLACVSLLVFLLFYRASSKDSGSLARLALLHGVQRLRGESEESLRHRTLAASRWPYSYPEARFVWWARAGRRMTRALRRGQGSHPCQEAAPWRDAGPERAVGEHAAR